MSSIIDELRIRYGYLKIYVGGSLARTLAGIDNSFNEDSDIDIYIFSDKPIVLDGYIYGHRVASTYIPIQHHDKLIYREPPNEKHYPVIDLNNNIFYILDLGYIFPEVVDDVYDY